MARALILEFKLNSKVEYETGIRGHYVYKCLWTSLMNENLECKIDTQSEAKEHNRNAIGVYCIMQQLDSANNKKMLVGYV